MTPPPNSALRKLWINASTASHTMHQLSMLEQAWLPLLISPSELPIFHAEDSFDSLVKFTAFETRLVEAMTHAGFNAEYKDAAGPQAGTHLPLSETETHSPHFAAKTHSPFFTGETKGDDGKQKNAATTEARMCTSDTGPVQAKPKPDRAKSDRTTIKTSSSAVDEKVAAGNPVFLITHSTRDLFVTRLEQASIRLAWDNSVVTIADALAPVPGAEQDDVARLNQPLQIPQVISDTNRSVREFATRSGEKSQWPLQRSSSSPPGRIDPMLPGIDTPGHPEIFPTTPSRGAHRAVHLTVTPNSNPLEYILRPAVERLVRSPQQCLLPKEVAARERSPETGWNLGIRERKSGDLFPLTGLRRLAAEAENVADVPVNKNKRSSPVDDHDSDVLTRATYPIANEGVDFSAQLTSLLRQEALRHGIDVEELQG